MPKDKSIQLPQPLYEQLKLQLEKSSFTSIDDFIVFILQSYLDKQHNGVDVHQPSKDDEAVLKRLKDLGYM